MSELQAGRRKKDRKASRDVSTKSAPFNSLPLRSTQNFCLCRSDWYLIPWPYKAAKGAKKESFILSMHMTNEESELCYRGEVDMCVDGQPESLHIVTGSSSHSCPLQSVVHSGYSDHVPVLLKTFQKLLMIPQFKSPQGLWSSLPICLHSFAVHSLPHFQPSCLPVFLLLEGSWLLSTPERILCSQNPGSPTSPSGLSLNITSSVQPRDLPD